LKLDWTYLGTVAYQKAMQLQYEYAKNVVRGAEPRLFVLQHPPTVTLGRHSDLSNLCLEPKDMAQKGIRVFQVLRGGDVTFHGPGQLVGYTVARLDHAGCTVPKWVQGHAEAIVRFLKRYGIESRWSEKYPGVWVGREKIAALGFHILRRVSTHGVAINLNPDLSYFRTIVPCGLRNHGVTSMVRLRGKVPEMSNAAGELAEEITKIFGWVRGEVLDAGEILSSSSIGASVFEYGETNSRACSLSKFGSHRQL